MEGLSALPFSISMTKGRGVEYFIDRPSPNTADVNYLEIDTFTTKDSFLVLSISSLIEFRTEYRGSSY